MTVLGSSKEFNGNLNLGSRGRGAKPASPAIAIYFYWLTVGLIVFADQFTKWIIAHTMALNESLPVIGDIVHLTYVRNRGAAFSLLAEFNTPWRLVMFLGVAGLAVIGLTVMAYREQRRGLMRLLPLGLVSGGALGNLMDRAASGAVVDFIAVSYRAFHWPVFNLADSAVVTGVAWLLLAMINMQPKSKAKH